jgi:antitoxin PrlF
MRPVAKLSSKGQATIPLVVRRALNLSSGDSIAFEIDHGVVRIRRAEPIDIAYAKALEGTLSEWASDADEKAYRDL